MKGIDYECLDFDEIVSLTRRFAPALHNLTDECRLYQYLFKRTNPTVPYRDYDDLPVVNRAIQGRMEFMRGRAEISHQTTTHTASPLPTCREARPCAGLRCFVAGAYLAVLVPSGLAKTSYTHKMNDLAKSSIREPGAALTAWAGTFLLTTSLN